MKYKIFLLTFPQSSDWDSSVVFSGLLILVTGAWIKFWPCPLTRILHPIVKLTIYHLLHIWGGGNLLSFLLRCGTRPYERGHPMRLELTRVGLLVELANHYTTRGALLHHQRRLTYLRRCSFFFCMTNCIIDIPKEVVISPLTIYLQKMKLKILLTE